MARPFSALRHLGTGLPITKKARNQADVQLTEMLQKRTFNEPVVGAGHQGNSNLPVIREVANHPQMQAAIDQGYMEAGTKTYKMGKVKIFVSPPDARLNQPGWHLSISHPDRYPTWDEVASAWYQLVPDADNRVGQMALPKKAHYISIHNYCFQVHEQVEDAALEAELSDYAQESYVVSLPEITSSELDFRRDYFTKVLEKSQEKAVEAKLVLEHISQETKRRSEGK